ncbi:dehydrogenase, E1 component, partial [Tanacetum coccineum]
FVGDGVVAKGQAYGIQSIRVDGNDVLAVYNAVHCARDIARNEQRPILIEVLLEFLAVYKSSFYMLSGFLTRKIHKAMTYRVGHHSTSYDSTKYRAKDEIEQWKTVHSPIARFRKWIQGNSWWSQNEETELHIDVKKQVKNAIDAAEREEKTALTDMFTDVYEEVPSNLVDQERSLRETINRYQKDFPTNVPL